MLLRFISLLLVLFQESIQSICIDESYMERWLPCRSRGGNAVAHYGVVASTYGPGERRLLSRGGAEWGRRCPQLTTILQHGLFALCLICHNLTLVTSYFVR
jgi:hypothetical protein